MMYTVHLDLPIFISINSRALLGRKSDYTLNVYFENSNTNIINNNNLTLVEFSWNEIVDRKCLSKYASNQVKCKEDVELYSETNLLFVHCLIKKKKKNKAIQNQSRTTLNCLLFAHFSYSFNVGTILIFVYEKDPPNQLLLVNT